MEILKRVVNYKLRMVYFLIVYIVLLIQFPEQNLFAPPNNKTWIRHCVLCFVWYLLSLPILVKRFFLPSFLILPRTLQATVNFCIVTKTI